MTRCLVKDCNKRGNSICIDCYESFCDEHIEHTHLKDKIEL